MSFGMHRYIRGFSVLGHSIHTMHLILLSLDLTRHRRQTVRYPNATAAGWVLDRQCWYKHCTARLV